MCVCFEDDYLFAFPLTPFSSSHTHTHTHTHIQLSLLEDALTELRKFEAELKVKSSHLAHLRVDISHPLASLEQLKGESVVLVSQVSLHTVFKATTFIAFGLCPYIPCGVAYRAHMY